jgi:hypothetical protein
MSTRHTKIKTYIFLPSLCNQTNEKYVSPFSLHLNTPKNTPPGSTKRAFQMSKILKRPTKSRLDKLISTLQIKSYNFKDVLMAMKEIHIKEMVGKKSIK